MSIKYLGLWAVLCLSNSAMKARTLIETADSIRRACNIPELGYAVVKTDTITVVNVIGYHRIDRQTARNKACAEDFFHLGSNTKAITGLIAARLVEEGKIQWTTKFFSLFPALKSGSDTAYADITLSDLLSHRAGIQPYVSGNEYRTLPKFKGSTQAQRKQFAAYLLTQPPVTADSELYHYSNAGYSVAAIMLEKVSGKSWEQLVDELLKQALHLKYCFGWPNKKSTDQPWGHWQEGDNLRALPPSIDYNLHLAEPAGDISMPLPDYARLVQLQLQGLEGHDNILKSDTYRFLHYGLDEYAIGWVNINAGGEQISEHAGSAGTFYVYTVIDKRKGIAFVVAANAATEQAQQGLLALLKSLRKQYG